MLSEVLTVGPDWMDPAWHGQGIMTAVIRAVVHDWAVPRMNARRICVSIVTGNIASVRVFEKNGFVLERAAMKESVTLGGQAHTGQSISRWERT